MAIRWEAKRPAEVRDYSHDWTPFLGDDSIATSVWTASGATLDSDVFDDTTVTVWVSGGTSGVARLTNTVTTVGGRTESETFTLRISQAEEPVSISDARAHLRLVDDSEDALVESYIRAAREWVENYTGLVLVQREFVEHRDCFGRFIELYRHPIVPDSVSISYTDTSGASQSYAEPVYSIERRPARIYPALNGWWPSLGRNGGVEITYTAGFEEGEVPQALIQAILVLIGVWFENRSMAEIPAAAHSLCDQYRMPTL